MVLTLLGGVESCLKVCCVMLPIRPGFEQPHMIQLNYSQSVLVLGLKVAFEASPDPDEINYSYDENNCSSHRGFD